MLDVCWALFEIELHRHPDRRPNDVWTEITTDGLGIVPHPEWSWWALRGQLYRWVSVKGMRLHTDAQIDNQTEATEARWIWRLTAEDPKIELTAESTSLGERSPGALLPLARACIQYAG